MAGVMDIVSSMRKHRRMRTTVDLSPELLRRLRDLARREGVTFKKIINRVVQRGLDARAAPRRRPRPLPTFSMGSPYRGVRLDKALSVACQLEDEALAGKQNPHIKR
jgi:hypothetical protein